MNARDIQQSLFNQFGGSSLLMVPNYTPKDWFECDLFRITKAGFTDEFEIKLSVSDFKADAKKGPDEHERARRAFYKPESFDGRTKHERLAEGDTKGPRRFWFAMPEEVAEKVEIPLWAGLLTFRTWRGKTTFNGISCKQTARYIKAPVLHRGKVSSEVSAHALRVFYYRYWTIRNGQPEHAAATLEP